MLRVLIILNLLLFQDGEPKVVPIPIDNPAYTVLTSLETNNYHISTEFSLRFFEKKNPLGSADGVGHEITKAFYLVISDRDDYPKRTVFEVGPFYQSTIKDIRTDKDLIELDIEFFGEKQKEVITVVVGHHSVVLRK